MISYRKIFAEELGRVCRDGEEVVDVMTAMYGNGYEKRPSDRNSVSFDLLNGLDVSSWNNAIEKFVGGLTLDVRQGHQASDMVKAFKGGSDLVLTTQRLLVLQGVKTDSTPTVCWDSELDSISALTHSPRPPIDVGRIRIDFVDGSMIRLWGGFVWPFSSRRFAASFTSTVGR